MAGGLLNIVSIGNANIFLTGNPTKTFFNVVYSKYTNFGLQKFRLDYDGARDLRLTTDSVFTFKVKRYAELLMDTYVVLTLPDIWSPVYSPTTDTSGNWSPYEFRWIKDIGSKIIRSIDINCGSLKLQSYTGDYLAALVDRDFSAEKKDLYNKMTGNVPELYDPANAFQRTNSYPNAIYDPTFTNAAGTFVGAEPSIRGRTLYVPINTWFTLNSNCAFPLIALQYNELTITVTLRPIQELYQVRDPFQPTANFPYVQPNYTGDQFQLYRFLQSPPQVITTNSAVYPNTTSGWNADVHLLSTYCFLSKEEAQLFAREDQVYLVKDVFQYFYENVIGTQRVKLTSNGMIASWMFYLQRNDVNMRNEWSNYLNWPYDSLPQNVVFNNTNTSGSTAIAYTTNQDGTSTGIMNTGGFTPDNTKHILLSRGVLLDGEYRENTLTRGVYDYVEKYIRTKGSAKEGLYCYNFCLNTDPFEYQPSGAINLSKFKNVELEVATFVPPIDPAGAAYTVVCDSAGSPIGVSQKPSWMLYYYTYNMTVFEERYNVLSFVSGNAGMLYSR